MITVTHIFYVGVFASTTAVNSACVRFKDPVSAAIEKVLTGPPCPTVPLWITIKGFPCVWICVRCAKTFEYTTRVCLFFVRKEESKIPSVPQRCWVDIYHKVSN